MGLLWTDHTFPREVLDGRVKGDCALCILKASDIVRGESAKTAAFAKIWDLVRGSKPVPDVTWVHNSISAQEAGRPYVVLLYRADQQGSSARGAKLGIQP